MWIGYVLAAICLYFAFRGISFRDFGETLSHARPIWILLALPVYLIGYVLRSERWAILIQPVHPIAARDLFWLMIIGFFANNVLPLRMGELVRAHICGTKFKISRTASLGTILLERLCDTLSFLTTFLVVAMLYPFPRFVEKGALLLGGACLGVIAALILIKNHESPFLQILDQVGLPASWKEKIRHATTHFIHSVSGITRPRYVAEAIGLSLVIWTLEGTFLFMMAHAFAVKLQYSQAFFLLFVLGLSVTIPQAPGYVGTMELFGVTALSLLGIPKEQGLPVILAIHGMQFTLIAVLGAIGLWREGLSFHNLVATT